MTLELVAPPQPYTDYQYTLDRGQRLPSLLQAWGWGGAAGILLLVIFFSAAVSQGGWVWFPTLAWVFVMRGLLRGLLQIAGTQWLSVSLVIEDDRIGIGPWDAPPKMWIGTDAIARFWVSSPGVWSLLHHDGTLLQIPAEEISAEDVGFLQEKARAYAGKAARPRAYSH